MKSRGSALVSVILVLLVLTIVGVGIAYFTSMEDRLSGNTRIAKAGFYAADAGLREAEAALVAVSRLPGTCPPITLTSILGTGGAPITVPGGGYQAIPLDMTSFNTVGCLAPSLQILYQNIAIPVVAGTPVVDRVQYSLFVRNNVDDPSGNATTDGDQIINVVSIGSVQLTGGSAVTRILEEQLKLSSGSSSSGPQKDLNAGGSNAVGKQ